jgi:UDP-N-acetylglucosamine:LPS N-acetylglucosamine transferase
MRVLIFTSSGGTAHDAAAYALRDWLRLRRPATEVLVEHVLENASPVTRGGVELYNWIQRRQPWLHQLYWRLVEFEDLVKPGRPLFGRRYVIALLRRFRPDVVISTHPHINRGHFDLAKRVLGPQLRCITCNTELDGGFGFSRNWVCSAADQHWTQTPQASVEVCRRRWSMARYPAERVRCLGPLLYPAFHGGARASAQPPGRPRLVLASGANGANNHIPLLEQMLPYADRLELVALCGRRDDVRRELQRWADQHPQLSLEVLGFQGPEQMAELYRSAWAHVARPGARTATEALFMGCPLIFNRMGSTMPQESLAVRYYQRRQLATSIRSPWELRQVVGGWLKAPERYAEWRQRYRDHRLTSDPDAILASLFDPDT